MSETNEAKNKVILILSDGLRPDTFSPEPFMPELTEHAYYCLKTRTVMPSVTLPCHMSLFCSVAPDRHGILTNTYVPQVRPVNGLYEVLSAAKKKCAIFYDWEELRDLSRPGSLDRSYFIAGHDYGYENTCATLTDETIAYVKAQSPDFVFLYYGDTDECGHAHGWLSPEYKAEAAKIRSLINKIIAAVPSDYIVAVTADHGGHGRSHGTEMPEDMTIPLLFCNRSYRSTELSGASILDIAPTIASLLGVAPDGDWEGKKLY